MLKYLMVAAGTISLGLGILGIFIPGLPTTPFILLTAALYVKSSPKLYEKLKNHKVTGKYLIKAKEGFSLKTMIVSSSIMWAMIMVTIIWVIDSSLWKVLLVVIGIIGTIVKLLYSSKKQIIHKTK